VQLFLQRAQAAHSSFELTADNATHIAELCRRLDGLPLAVELAAARVPLLTPEAMLKRLGDRLKLLTAGARDAPLRQQTSRNTLVWSHELLHDNERALFARVAVFLGGFSLEAVEAVCDAEIDTLAALVDRSMMVREGDRFRLLETVRDFALEQCAASEDRAAVVDRHARYFEALVERVYEDRWDKEKKAWTSSSASTTTCGPRWSISMSEMRGEPSDWQVHLDGFGTSARTSLKAAPISRER
jgi:predicted ATPase